jgi:hypothetical protein
LRSCNNEQAELVTEGNVLVKGGASLSLITCAAYLAAGGVSWHNFSRLVVLPYSLLRARMNNRISVSKLSAGLAYPSSDTLQGLRLWEAFIRLSPSQRSEVLALVEELANHPTPHPDGIGRRLPAG